MGSAAPRTAPAPPSAASAPVPRPDQGAVPKTVTVLFADLGGSTGFGERTDPGVARVVRAGIDIQDRFERFAAEIVSRYGETLTARPEDESQARARFAELSRT